MQLGRLRHQLLIAMGLPACWTATSPGPATPPDPPPPPDHGVAHVHHDHSKVATDDDDRFQWTTNTAYGVRQSCTPETVCGRSDTKHGPPNACGPHGDSLESFSGNYQKLSVTRMSWGANPGELRLFDLDAGESAAYKRTVQVATPDLYCCYSHCTPSLPSQQMPVPPAGQELVIACTAAPLQVANPHRDNPACEAMDAGRPYVYGTDAQCCFAGFQPIPPPVNPYQRHMRGRAARVEGEVVVAAVREGSTWDVRELRPRLEGLDVTSRTSLRDAWQAAAQMEHASVAAFSALSLRLMALGAPADLIARCHTAALDEIRHAQITFAFASAYADAPLEPARFDQVAGLATTSTMVELALETFIDGCIEETTAAVDASLAASSAGDPMVAGALRSIADDETRHAELAWAIVAWCVRIEPAIADSLNAALATQLAAPSPIARAHPLGRYGVRSASESAATRARVLREVVAPCLAALISANRSRGIA
jgi:hypothetical protein